MIDPEFIKRQIAQISQDDPCVALCQIKELYFLVLAHALMMDDLETFRECARVSLMAIQNDEVSKFAIETMAEYNRKRFDPALASKDEGEAIAKAMKS